MQNYNLIKVKSSKGGMYIFDAITNNIFSIEDEKDFDSFTIYDLGHDSEKRNCTSKHKNIELEVLSNAKTLVIELTEKCNLRCSYCVFDKDSKLERSHTNQSIDIDHAFRMIDEFYKRASDSVAYIVFYGGEPLLEFKNIVTLVDYANRISNNKIKFSFTTNGVLLTNEKFEFLIQNDFLITVSIDGNKDVHDKFRITNNGKGTFDTILWNLSNLEKYDANYYKNKIQINCVITDSDHISTINDYFEEAEFDHASIRFSPIIQNQLSINSYITSLILKNPSPQSLRPIEKSFISDIIKKIEYRELDERAKNGKKLCIPFSNRTYARVDKSLQFCERIGEFAKTGIETNLVNSSKNIISEYHKLIENECSICFAYNFCEMCPASFIIDGSLDSNLAKNKCGEYRKLVEMALRMYINNEE